MTEVLAKLLKTVNEIDEACRKRMQTYSDTKAKKGALFKKDGGNLPSRDLVDVLTPEIVAKFEEDYGGQAFPTSEYLTTVAMILSKDKDKELPNCYEHFGDGVVPKTAAKFKADDKDGNTLWRVVLFKSGLEPFKKAAKDAHFIVREFEYDANGYKNLQEERAKVKH